MFHLETHMKTTKTLSWISGVYWSARDMDDSPFGNHHFITFIYDSLDQANRITKKWAIKYFSEVNDKGISVLYTTVGIGKDGKKSGKIIFGFTPGSDRKAIHEIAKDENTSWDNPDADYEGHRIHCDDSRSSITSNEILMDEILQRVFNFNAHHNIGETVDYCLIDENCATGVNSIFRVLGFPLELRKKLGEFNGIDWGEEDKIPGRYFAPLQGLEAKISYPGIESSWLSILLS